MSDAPRPPAAWFVQKSNLREISAIIRQHARLRTQEKELMERIQGVQAVSDRCSEQMDDVKAKCLAGPISGARLSWGKARLDELEAQARALSAETANLQMRLEKVRREMRRVEARIGVLHARGEMLQELLDQTAQARRMIREDSIHEETLEAILARSAKVL